MTYYKFISKYNEVPNRLYKTFPNLLFTKAETPET